MTIRCLVDICRTSKRSASIVFVDYRKAFDSVRRASIAPILRMYGVSECLVRAITSLYKDTSARIQTAHGPTDSFRTSSGVLQGDTLSPFLFIMMIDYVLRCSLSESLGFEVSPRRSSRQPAKYVTALAYADDIALVARDSTCAAIVMSRLQEVSARHGLAVDLKKSSCT